MDNSDFEKIILILESNIPSNYFLDLIIIILRTIPVFLVCHDWNIFYKYSITYIISYYSGLPLLHQSNAKKISFYLVLVFFILSIVNLLIFLKLYNEIKQYNKTIHSNIFYINIKIIYLMNFVISPFIFMICSENFFCTPIYDVNISYKLIKTYKDDCRDFKNIFIIIIQTIILIWNFFLNIIFSILVAKPVCISSSFIVTKLNELKFKLVFFPLFQIILVFDYYLSFKICVGIKIIIRIIYIIFYIKFIFIEPKNFYINWNLRLISLFIYSMNFFSCIIEFIFLFDFNNNLIILQKNQVIIVFKILVEISLSMIILQIINNKEKKYTLEAFENKLCLDYPYELLNKIFFIFNHIEKKIGNDLLYEIIECFDTFFKNHIKEKKCSKIVGLKCFCKNFVYQDFLVQVDNFLNSIKEIRDGVKKENKLLKNKFPIMYKYIEYVIKSEMIKNKNYSRKAFFILALVLFYIIFDKNYNKSLFYVEEFSNSKFYKENKLVRLQCKLIKLIILEDYKNFYIYSQEENINKNFNENSFPEMYKIYSELIDQINLENNLNLTIEKYIKTINYFKDEDCTFHQCMNYMKSFKKQLKKMNNYLKNKYSKNSKNSYYLNAKLTIFYSFFYADIPHKISICYKNIFEIDFKDESFSMLILNTYNNKNSWKFTIEYASDELCSKLNYKLYEIKGKEINELFPDSLKKCFEYIILEKIRIGSVQILLREIVLLNKEKYSNLYDIISIVIFSGEGLKLFMKVYPYDFKYSKQIGKNKKKNNKLINEGNLKKDNKIKAKKNIEECFIFINKNGKIIAISKGFEYYFCLNLDIIKKFKINLFKDILKVENIEIKDTIKKNLVQIYENIEELNISLMHNNSNEEFSQSYKQIKKMQKEIIKKNTELICNFEEREIPKNEKLYKIYYFVSFNLEIDKKFVALEDFISNEQNNNHSIQSKFKEPIKTRQIKIELNYNQNENLNKIRQIQILSIKQLITSYNINMKGILNLNQKEEKEINEYNNMIEEKTNRLMSTLTSYSNKSTNQMILNDNSDKLFEYNKNPEFSFSPIKKKNHSDTIKKNIYLQVLIWIFFTIFFIILQTYLLIIERKNKKKTQILNEILVSSLITRNIIYSFVSSLVSMQFIANNLQTKEILDNGFINTINHHKNKILEKIDDFLYYYKLFERQEKYLCDYNEQEIIKIFYSELNYISVKSDNLISKNSLKSILSNSHLSAYEVVQNDIEIFLFNISYYTIENRKLLNESAFFQFVFDNYFCNGKYSWDEIDNLLIYDTRKDARNIMFLTYIINILNISVIILISIIQSYFFNKYLNQIYAKYYINYNYLVFFSKLLLKKTSIIKEFIDDCSSENLEKFKNKKIVFLNKIDDNNKFKNNYIRINNKLPLIIKPYQIKLIENDENFKEINLSNFSKKKSSLSNIQEITNKKFNDKGLTINYNLFNFQNNKKLTFNLKSVFENKMNIMNEHIDNNIKVKRSMKLKKVHKKKSMNDITKDLIKGNTKNIKTTNEDKTNETLKNTLDFTNEINQISVKKDLQKPKILIISIFFFLISASLIIIFLIITDIIIYKSLEGNFIFSVAIKNMVEALNTRMEIFLMYAITLLKGEVITFEYHSNGYLNSFPQLKILNDYKVHNILQEALVKHDLFNNQFNQYLTANRKKFLYLSYFFSKFNGKEACDFIYSYYYKNKNIFGYSQFNSLNNYNEENLIEICKNISKGINSKGIKGAIDSLVSTIKSRFNEFKEDMNKGENLLARIQDEKFISYQMEIEYILSRNVPNFVICWKIDKNRNKRRIKKFIIVFYILIIALILIILCFYLIIFPFKTLKANEIITKVEPCYYNTIMY